MISLNEFLDCIEDIASESPSYRTGGTAKDGTCDCVGLIMGAMYRSGHWDYPLHSSNYFARFQTGELLPVSDLKKGMAVYKFRDGSETLNARYLSGGRYYNGDIKDYYHVGVVVSDSPLKIVHCTSGNGINGIAIDTKIGNWNACGFINDINYEEGEKQTAMKATVISSDGKPVNIRQKPDKKANRLYIVPVGTAVDVVTSGDGWSTVDYKGQRGYIMSEFLQVENQEPELELDIEDEMSKEDECLFLLREIRDVLLDCYSILKRSAEDDDL